MNLSHWVIVFDLDDTLISELEYQRSGISEVEKVINSIYNVSFEGRIQRALNDGVQDIFGWACEELGLPADVKSSFLWIYRLHSPDIKLAKGVEDLVSRLLDCGANLAILSDGRSITQRLKLRAIGLQHLPLFISEDHQSTKPEINRFVSVEEKWPHCSFVYVADNASKDFSAPRSRDWLTIGARWVSPRVYSSFDQDSSCSQPDFWVEFPSKVFDIICGKIT